MIVYLVWVSALVTVFSDWLTEIEEPYRDRRIERWRSRARAKRPPLHEALASAASGRVAERRQAAKILGVLDEDEVPESEREALVRALLALSDDPDPLVGAEGLKALGSQSNLVEGDRVSSVFACLLKHLDDGDRPRSRAAAQAIAWFDLPEDAALLGEVLPRILVLPGSKDPVVRRAALKILANAFEALGGPHDAAALRAARALPADADNETRYYAAGLLFDEAARTPAPKRETLVVDFLPLSRDAYSPVRSSLAELLEETAGGLSAEGGARAVEALLRLASDSDGDVRASAVHALLALRGNIPPDLRAPVERILTKYRAK